MTTLSYETSNLSVTLRLEVSSVQKGERDVNKNYRDITCRMRAEQIAPSW